MKQLKKKEIIQVLDNNISELFELVKQNKIASFEASEISECALNLKRIKNKIEKGE